VEEKKNDERYGRKTVEKDRYYFLFVCPFPAMVSKEIRHDL